jgi:hypothetical protein
MLTPAAQLFTNCARKVAKTLNPQTVGTAATRGRNLKI